MAELEERESANFFVLLNKTNFKGGKALRKGERLGNGELIKRSLGFDYIIMRKKLELCLPF